MISLLLYILFINTMLAKHLKEISMSIGLTLHSMVKDLQDILKPFFGTMFQYKSRNLLSNLSFKRNSYKDGILDYISIPITYVCIVSEVCLLWHLNLSFQDVPVCINTWVMPGFGTFEGNPYTIMVAVVGCLRN